MMRSKRLLLAAWIGLAPAFAQAGAKIEISEDRWITLGAGVRTSFSAVEDGAPSGSDYSKDVDLESFRFYTGGQLFKYMSVEFNAEYDGDQEVRVLDGVVKLEYAETFNLWAGRFLPPSDRSNLSGPYYLNSFDFPFVQQYPAIFAGRDEGIAYWGQMGEGMFKWQAGLFEGSDSVGNDDDNLLYSGRLTLNLWDPEPGYYNSSTYYGEKDVFAIGLVGMKQKDGSAFPSTVTDLTTVPPTASSVIQDGDFTGWNVDVLIEKNFDELGVLTLEGAYYDYDRDDLGTAANEGDGYFVVASWLMPGEIGPEGLKGRLQPILRFQQFDPEVSGGDEHTRFDIGVNYILDGHNARLSFTYSRDDGAPTALVPGMEPPPGSELDDRNLFKIGLQIQL